MHDYLDVEIGDVGLRERAPRFKVLAKSMPKYVNELEHWQCQARDYAQRFIRPKALEIDKRCQVDPSYFDWELVGRSTPYGFLSMFVPSAIGGGGQLTTALAIVMEEMCAACAGVANIFGATGLGVSGLLLGLDLYHYDRALTELVEGDRKGQPVLFAAAITEPLAGSDVEDAGYLQHAKLQTEVKPVRGGYRINGRKVFISNGSVAKYTTLIAPLDKTQPVATQSAFLVKQGDPGFSVGHIESKMGMKACPATELVFDDCFIPAERLIGAEGSAVSFIETVLGASRGPVGAIATGTARGAFERVVEFAKNNQRAGRRLIDHGWVQLKLADMARKIHLCRQAYLDACMSFDFQGVPRLLEQWPTRIGLGLVPSFVRKHRIATAAIRSNLARKALDHYFETMLDPADQRHIQQYSSMAKVSASDIAVEITYDALQIVGLEGALYRHELEKIFRDAKLTQIYEGTNELNRHNIFKNTFSTEPDRYPVVVPTRAGALS